MRTSTSAPTCGPKTLPFWMKVRVLPRISYPISREMLIEIEFCLVQEGMIFKFQGGQTGNVTDDCGLTSLVPCPIQKADLVFTSSVPKSRFGFEFIFLASTVQSSYQVAVSSIHANVFNSRLSGTVSIFPFSASQVINWNILNVSKSGSYSYQICIEYWYWQFILK